MTYVCCHARVVLARTNTSGLVTETMQAHRACTSRTRVWRNCRRGVGADVKGVNNYFGPEVLYRRRSRSDPPVYRPRYRRSRAVLTLFQSEAFD